MIDINKQHRRLNNITLLCFSSIKYYPSIVKRKLVDINHHLFRKQFGIAATFRPVHLQRMAENFQWAAITCQVSWKQIAMGMSIGQDQQSRVESNRNAPNRECKVAAKRPTSSPGQVNWVSGWLTDKINSHCWGSKVNFAESNLCILLLRFYLTFV